MSRRTGERMDLDGWFGLERRWAVILPASTCRIHQKAHYWRAACANLWSAACPAGATQAVEAAMDASGPVIFGEGSWGRCLRCEAVVAGEASV